MVKKKASPLDPLFDGLQKSLSIDLGTYRKGVAHAPTKGRGSEKRWIDAIQHHLPKRYCVGEAFVVDSRGGISDQLDIVIYDSQYSALFFDRDDVRHVPAESVYAVFEIKQEVTATELDYSAKKFESVRKLYRTSAPVCQIDGRLKKKTPPHITSGVLALKSGYSPPFSSAFRNKVKSFKGKKAVDFICSAEDGVWPWNQNPEKALATFIFRLLELLQKKGNPAAVDYSAYLRMLSRDN